MISYYIVPLSQDVKRNIPRIFIFFPICRLGPPYFLNLWGPGLHICNIGSAPQLNIPETHKQGLAHKRGLQGKVV
jgi:hypothetical protein